MLARLSSLALLFAAIALLTTPTRVHAAGLAFSLDMRQTELPDGQFLYEYHLENAAGDNLPLLSLCMEVGSNAALDDITGPPGWEIVYDSGGATHDMLCYAGLFDFAWIPPGEYGDFAFVSPLGSTAANYYAVVGLSYDYEESEGFEGTILTPFSAPYVPGDADGDQDVDLEDLNLVRNNFGASGTAIPGDTNDDGTVDLGDLNDVRNHFGTAAGAAAVPEPGALSTAACIGFLLFVCQRAAPGRHNRRPVFAVIGAVTFAAFSLIESTFANPIPLGNLFDDAKETVLTHAISTDTYGAVAEEGDLGVLYIDPDLSAPIRIAPGQWLNLAPVGGTEHWADPIANDVSIAPGNWPIRTLGQLLPGETAPKIEEGIGIHANNAITFDLDEIRVAGGFGLRQPLRFTAEGAINDIALGSEGEFRLAAIVTGTGDPEAYVNGEPFPVQLRELAWEFTSPEGLSALSGRGVTTSFFDVPIAGAAKYLTLASIAIGSHAADHAVFSEAMLWIDYVSGDTDGDGDVDLDDLNNVRNTFGGTGDQVGDTNDDGVVDLDDLNDVRNHFGTTAGAAAVPEPGSITIALFALSAIVVQQTIRRGLPIGGVRLLTLGLSLACLAPMATVVAASPPTDGMVLWLDATDASTVVDDQGQTAASGQFSGMVREWRDKSPNHFDAIQTDPASQPEYLPGVIHGRPSLRMDGLDFLSLEPVLSFGNAISIYTVIQLDDLSNRDDRDGIFSGADAFGVRGGAELWAGGDDGPVLGQIYVDRSFPSAFDDEGGIVLVLGASYDGANSIFALNGQSETVPYQLRGGGWADDKYMVGRSPFEGGGGLNGLMGELLVYDRCLDANERLLVEQYLTKKYSESQAGDADRDGDVDLEDLNLVRNHFGETGQNIPGDANGDGTVDLVDLNDVRNHFGAVAGGAAVAEPGAGSLLLWAITATYFLRRKWASVARFMP